MGVSSLRAGAEGEPEFQFAEAISTVDEF